MHQPIPLSDPCDPRFDPYRELKLADAPSRRGGFIAEGAVVVEKAARSVLHPLRSVLLAERLHPRVTGRLDALGPEVALFTAPQAVLDAVCGFPLHRGVLAYGVRPPPPAAADLLGRMRGGVWVGAIGVGDAENMGALFRNAAAFGAAGVVLDAGCCDPLYRRAIRVSVGAALLLPHARLSPGEDMVDLFTGMGVEVLALSPGGRETLAGVQPRRPLAVLVGSEGPGLPEAVLARTRSVRIPMAGGFDSLNVATALAVALARLQPGDEAS